MARRKIRIEEFVSDVRGGMSDTALGKKYNLSQNQLEKLYDNLLKAGQLSPSDLDEAAPSFEPTVELAFTCAKCGALKLIDSDKCPQCGDEGLPEEKTEAAPEFEEEEPIPEFDPSAVDLAEEDTAGVGFAEESTGEADSGTEDGGADSIFLEPAAESEPPVTEHGALEDEVTFVHDLEPQLDLDVRDESARAPIRLDLSHAEASELSPRKPEPRRWKTPLVALAAVFFALIAAVGAGIYTKIIPAPDLAKLPFIGTPNAPEVETPLVAQRPWEKRKRTAIHREKKPAVKSEKSVHPRTEQARTAPEPKKAVAQKDERKPRVKPSSLSSAGTSGKSAVLRATPPQRPETKKPTRVAAANKAGAPAPIRHEVKPAPVPPKTDNPASSAQERKPEAVGSPVSEKPAPEDQAESRRVTLQGSRIDSETGTGAAPDSRDSARPRARKPEQATSSPMRSGEPSPESGEVRASTPASTGRASRPKASTGSELTAKARGTHGLKPDMNPASRPRTVPAYGSPTRAPEPPSAVPPRRTAALTAAVEPPRRPRPLPARVGASQGSASFEAWLLEAAKKGQTDVVRRLLENGVDANAKDRDGTTALMFAAGMGHLAVVRLLLKHGADVRSVNDQGISALAWAYSPPGDMGGTISEQRRVVRLLKEYGASPVGAGTRR